MAMEGTHIRFALDLRDKLQPKDLTPYIAGSVYPDSRYVSGIDRWSTHPKDYRDDPFFMSSDFRKGWFAHLLCDDVQYTLMSEQLPQVCVGIDGQGSETWVKRTAIKVLQDIEDVCQFDLSAHLPALSHIECPNGEPEQTMRDYHALIKKTYKHTPDISIEDSLIVWAGFNIGDELLQVIREKAQEYANDAATMMTVKKLYEYIRAEAI